MPKSIIWLGGLIAAGLVVATLVGAFTFYKIRSFDNALTVTGSAKQAVTSDTVKWVTNFTRTVKVSNLKLGYDQMDKDLVLVKKFLADNGLAEKDLIITPVFMEEVFKYGSDQSTSEKEYLLRQRIEVNSKEIEKITNLSKNTQTLINQNVIFSTLSLEYYYSKLAELRVSLLADAVKDAKARASKIAEAGGQKVGSLKAASSGVVQVVSPNSLDVADYGTYDTSQINKEVMVTVKASFTLK